MAAKNNEPVRTDVNPDSGPRPLDLERAQALERARATHKAIREALGSDPTDYATAASKLVIVDDRTEAIQGLTLDETKHRILQEVANACDKAKLVLRRPIAYNAETEEGGWICEKREKGRNASITEKDSDTLAKEINHRINRKEMLANAKKRKEERAAETSKVAGIKAAETSPMAVERTREALTDTVEDRTVDKKPKRATREFALEIVSGWATETPSPTAIRNRIVSTPDHSPEAMRVYATYLSRILTIVEDGDDQWHVEAKPAGGGDKIARAINLNLNPEAERAQKEGTGQAKIAHPFAELRERLKPGYTELDEEPITQRDETLAATMAELQGAAKAAPVKKAPKKEVKAAQPASKEQAIKGAMTKVGKVKTIAELIELGRQCFIAGLVSMLTIQPEEGFTKEQTPTRYAFSSVDGVEGSEALATAFDSAEARLQKTDKPYLDVAKKGPAKKTSGPAGTPKLGTNLAPEPPKKALETMELRELTAHSAELARRGEVLLTRAQNSDAFVVREKTGVKGSAQKAAEIMAVVRERSINTVRNVDACDARQLFRYAERLAFVDCLDLRGDIHTWSVRVRGDYPAGRPVVEVIEVRRKKLVAEYEAQRKVELVKRQKALVTRAETEVPTTHNLKALLVELASEQVIRLYPDRVEPVKGVANSEKIVGLIRARQAMDGLAS